MGRSRTQKPVIGLSVGLLDFANYAGVGFQRPVALAGGLPLTLPRVGNGYLKEVLEVCDGILLGGGRDIDPSFYVTGYLRSWALQSQLREHFRERFGSEWFADRKAGGMLRELWSEGHRLNADELLADVTGQELEMEAFAQTLREQLR